jgi:Uma2 family endonuclease
MIKTDYSIIPFKHGSEYKNGKAELLQIKGVPLYTIYDRQSNLEHIVAELLEELKGYHLVKKDTAYIVNLGDKLARVESLELYEDKKTDLPLEFYEVEDGKLVLNNKKVGAL